MKIEAFVASLVSASMMAGCVTSSVQVPVSAVPALTQGTLGKEENVKEYWITPLPVKAGWVFLRQPQRRELVAEYPEGIVGTAPFSDLERVAPLKSPVSCERRDEFLVLKSATGDFIAPIEAVGMVRVTVPSTARKAAVMTAIVVPGTVTIGLVAVLVAGALKGAFNFGFAVGR